MGRTQPLDVIVIDHLGIQVCHYPWSSLMVALIRKKMLFAHVCRLGGIVFTTLMADAPLGGGMRVPWVRRGEEPNSIIFTKSVVKPLLLLVASTKAL